MVESGLEAFFGDYASAFNRFDRLAICRSLWCPCLMVGPDSVSVLATEDAIRANTEALLRHHEAAGFGRAVASVVSVRTLGSGLALSTVDWRVEKPDGALLWQFTNTYNLIERGGCWRIAVSTTHGAGA